MSRFLFCGSRDLDNSSAIWKTLHKIAAESDKRRDVTIVHGAAPGADSIAAYYADKMGFNVEPHPADWDHCDKSCYHKPREKDGKPYCPAAGPRRNREMLATGIDRVYAFSEGPLAESRGTKDMVEIARKAGVEVVLYEYSLVPHS